MVAHVTGLSCAGLQGMAVLVEGVVDRGLPNFLLVGLPTAAVKEARERVRAAVRASGLQFPLERITVSLSPADLPKEGTSLDLPVAVGLLAASGQCPAPPSDTAFFGELGLDGSVRPVRGALSMALAARNHGLSRLVCPVANAAEAALLPDVVPVPVESLAHVVRWLRQATAEKSAPCAGPLPVPPRTPPEGNHTPAPAGVPDVSVVRGQPLAITALELAAAGGHHLLLLGPPGSGKTLMATCLPGLLPPLDDDEAIEVTAIHSIAGQLPPEAGLIRWPPLRAPHHSTPVAALVGGGQWPRPGEVTLAHRGVLLLDELAEFRRETLEALREPLESGWVTVARLRGAERFPASFQLAATANPCPCGGAGRCRCSDRQVMRYRQALSGPLLDRIDIQVRVRRPRTAPTGQPARGTRTSADLRARVTAARILQEERFRRLQLPRRPGQPALNRCLEASDLHRWAPMRPRARRFLDEFYRRPDTEISPRGLIKIVRVARTAADLSGQDEIDLEHVELAAQFRFEVERFGTG